VEAAALRDPADYPTIASVQSHVTRREVVELVGEVRRLFVRIPSLESRLLAAEQVHLRRHTRLSLAVGMDPGYSADATIDTAIKRLAAAESARGRAEQAAAALAEYAPLLRRLLALTVTTLPNGRPRDLIPRHMGRPRLQELHDRLAALRAPTGEPNG
jgi:hypothetical protein